MARILVMFLSAAALACCLAGDPEYDAWNVSPDHDAITLFLANSNKDHLPFRLVKKQMQNQANAMLEQRHSLECHRTSKGGQ